MRLSRFLQYLFIAIVTVTVGFSLYQWNASRAALKVNTNQNLNTNGLVGHWTLDGADTVWTSSSAGTTLDTSGSGNTGTLSGMNRATTPVLGKLGQALYFDNMEIAITSSTPYTGTILTFSVWAKRPASFPANEYALYSAGSPTPGVTLEFDITNHICIKTHSGGTLSGSGVCTTATYTDTAWHHYVGVADGTNLKIYVDTKLVASSVQTITSSEIKNAGHIGSTSSRYFKGAIDDVRVYNRALSENEITDLYRMSMALENTSALQPQGIGNLNAGLMGYWKFDDGSGSTAADSSGNGNTGTLVNTPTWTTGQIGGGIGLVNASAQYVNLSNPATYDLTSTGQMTISAWVKSGSSIINSTLGIVKRGATNSVGAPDQYALTSSNTRWRFMAGNGTTYAEMFGPSGGLVADTWYHLTGVIDAVNISLYINGVSAATPVARPAGSPPVAVSTFIGTMMAGSNTWDGTIDEVRIYNRALSADEISRLYRLTTPTGVDTSLKGYWSLDGNATNWTSSTTGTTIDLSSYNNTGTLTNMNRATSSVIGKLGQSMNFIGSGGQKINFGSPSPLDDLEAQGGGGMTLSTWINPRTSGAGEGTIINKGNAANTSNGAWSLKFHNSSGRFGFEKSYATTVLSRVSLNGAISYNRWQHVLVTWDGSATATNIHIYVDGTEVSYQSAQDGVGSKVSDAANSISINDGVSSREFDGKIDETRLYNRILSAAEITDLYQTGVKKINTTQNINTNGLVGHWTLDGKDTVWSSSTAGTTLDTSGNGNTGTLTSLNRATSPAIGKLGQALDFASGGSGDYVNFGSAANLDDIETQGGGGMTVMAWINPRSSGGSTNSVIIGKSNSGTAGFWRMNNLGRLSFTKDFSTTDLTTMSNASNPLTYNQWQHVAATWDGSALASNIHLYINGAEISGYTSQVDGVGTAVSDAANSVYMSASATNEFDGKIDDARIYNRVLSAAEIAALYTSTR